jgi:hypothetical protein
VTVQSRAAFARLGFGRRRVPTATERVREACAIPRPVSTSIRLNKHHTDDNQPPQTRSEKRREAVIWGFTVENMCEKPVEKKSEFQVIFSLRL